MIHLLDVNLLIALFDPQHTHHDTAHVWFGEARETGWATCPTTENGTVRILSNPAYPGRRTTVADAAGRLAAFTESGHHVFWPEDISLLNSACIRIGELAGHQEITDAYLVAVALRHKGALATFDRGVRVGAVEGAGPRHVVVLGADD